MSAKRKGLRADEYNPLLQSMTRKDVEQAAVDLDLGMPHGLDDPRPPRGWEVIINNKPYHHRQIIVLAASKYYGRRLEQWQFTGPMGLAAKKRFQSLGFDIGEIR